MRRIKKIVDDLVKQHRTRSPFELCKRMQINVIFSDLPDKVNGLYFKSQKSGKRIILMNSELEENKMEWVCAHELGHAVLHSDINAMNYNQGYNIELSDLEIEADLFSLFLLETSNANG